MDSSPPSSVHGISWAKLPEWVAISFSRGSCQPRDQTQVSCSAGDSLPSNHEESCLGFQGSLKSQHQPSTLGETQQTWRRMGEQGEGPLSKERARLTCRPLFHSLNFSTRKSYPGSNFSPSCCIPTQGSTVLGTWKKLQSYFPRSCPCYHLTFRLVEIWSPNHSGKNSST